MNGRISNEMKIERGTEQRLRELPDYVGMWYLNLKASKKTAATCRDYICKIHNFLSFIGNGDALAVATKDITELNVNKFFLSIQTRTVNGEVRYTSDSYQCTMWCCLNNFLEYLASHGMIERNYIKDITKPRNTDLDRINESRVRLTSNDFKKILKAVDSENNAFRRTRDKAILTLFMSTGIRKTALCSITLGDINLAEGKLVVIDKGSKRHQFVLSDGACDALNDWMSCRGSNGNDNLFLSRDGEAIPGSTVRDIVEKYTEIALGKRLSPHKLRSGVCSILYSKSHDVEFVRRFIGHASSATTARYIVTHGDEKQKGAELLGNIF